jgi:hypothetical protein
MPAPASPPIRMRDWSMELEMLSLLADRLGEVIKAVVAVAGGKPPRIPPMPRPKTASDELRDPRRQHQKILSKVVIQDSDGSLTSAPAAAAARPAGPRVLLH